MTFLLLAFMAVAHAADPVRVPRNPLGRPAAMIQCPDGTTIIGRLDQGYGLGAAEICAKSKAEADHTVVDFYDAGTRRAVAIRGIDAHVSTYATGDTVATGDAAPIAAAYTHGGTAPGMGGNVYGLMALQQFRGQAAMGQTTVAPASPPPANAPVTPPAQGGQDVAASAPATTADNDADIQALSSEIEEQRKEIAAQRAVISGQAQALAATGK